MKDEIPIHAYDVVIFGVGYCGTLVAVHLVRVNTGLRKKAGSMKPLPSPITRLGRELAYRVLGEHANQHPFQINNNNN
jgi:hypothetical protein